MLEATFLLFIAKCFILLAALALLLILTIIDFKVKLLPNVYVFPYGALGIIFHTLNDFSLLTLEQVLIGGAFGVSEEVKSRANWRVNLSPMTLNHHVAAIVGLEQLYRALAINKNLPYHNS